MISPPLGVIRGGRAVHVCVFPKMIGLQDIGPSSLRKKKEGQILFSVETGVGVRVTMCDTDGSDRLHTTDPH